MNTYTAHLLNASTLILMGGWWFYSMDDKAAFLPILVGVMLLSITNGVKFGGKAVSRVAFLFTVLGLIALCIKPLGKSFSSTNIMYSIRVWAMTFTSILATLAFLMQTLKKK